MNNFHLVVVTACVLASPTAVRAQSIIHSEQTRTTLASSIDATGRTTLTASVTSERGGGVPGGIVRFVDETTLTVLGWVDVAHPSLVVERLPPGPHRFRADYMGTSNYLPVVVQPSQSAVVVEIIRGTPAVAVSSSENPCPSGAVVTLTAAIASGDGVPKGAVTFRDGEQILAAHVGLDRAGMASFTTSALADGARWITAEYEGDAVHAPAASARLTVDVGVARLRSSQLRAGD
ncbi:MULTISPECIES: Ig-like domain-containing protein [unclassified Tardiphaga]|uniref:Ig-like domain-containing protein n=1 Tax=unclassified Tardiphaga TaxID=2631404 RepID=UPI000E7257D5